MPEPPDNGKVTMAILGVKVDNLASTVERYHAELCREMRERDKDHEDRIRALEAAGRKSGWLDLGAYLVAIGAGIAGAITGKP